MLESEGRPTNGETILSLGMMKSSHLEECYISEDWAAGNNRNREGQGYKMN